MKKLFNLALVLILCSSCSSEWKLVWSDEFNGNSIDSRNWTKVERGASDWSNYMSNCDSLYDVTDGKLVLRGMANTILPADTAKFLTGGIYGKGKKFFGEGRIEICAKLDCARGFWPAIWMLPQKRNGWPDGGEIDIMEHLNSDSIVYQTIHSYYTQTLGIKDVPPHYTTHAYKPGEYNVFAVEKYADSLVFYVNNNRTFAYKRIQTDKQGQFPFNLNDFYLILSAQLGGSWVGRVEPNDLPVEMKIDWVRFYQKKK